MRIRWERIIGLFLIVAFVYLFIKLRPMLHNILKVVNEDYNYNSPMKAIMLGVLCLTLLAAIKLIFNK